MNNAYEREEDELYQDLAAGRITQAEFNKQLKEMQSAYRGECEEACWAAFENERNNW